MIGDINFRKDNTYYDRTGKQILVGDLLKVDHFTTGRLGKKMHYMYLVVVMEEGGEFPVMAVCDYTTTNPHCRMYVLCNNPERAYKTAKIINERDFQATRKKIKILN